MTNPQSTPETTNDFADFDLRHREHIRRIEELLPVNKAVLFDALASAGIETVNVTFDGYGDSSQIEGIDAGVGEESIPLPTDRIEIARTTWGSPDIQRQNQTVHEAIETLVYELLSQTHCGWENNDGAYGEFTFDVAERTITLDYNERYTSSENYSHEW